MSVPASRSRSWLLLAACMAVVGAFWTETEARACTESSPDSLRSARSCCVPRVDAPCCCREAVDDRPARGPGVERSTTRLAGRTPCGCAANPSIPADRPSRSSVSTSESKLVSGLFSLSPIREADAASRSFAALRTTPFDPLGTSVLMRTSRFRF